MKVLTLHLPSDAQDIGPSLWQFYIDGNGQWLATLNPSTLHDLEEVPSVTPNITIIDSAGEHAYPIVRDVVLDLRESTPNTPETAQAVTLVNLNVRAQASASAPFLHQFKAGTPIRVFTEYQDDSTYRWYKIAGGDYAGAFVAGKVLDTGVPWLDIASVITEPDPDDGDPPQPEPAPDVPQSSVAVVNRRFAFDGQARKFLGGALERKWVYPQYNPTEGVAGLDDNAYYGDPRFPDDGTFGKAQATQFDVMRVFTAHSYPSKTSNWQDMLDSNARMMAACKRFGLKMMPVMMDSIGSESSLAEYRGWHIGAGGHLDVGFWLTEQWRGAYFEWVRRFLGEFKEDEALGPVCLMNEPQIPENRFGDSNVLDAFIQFVNESYDLIHSIVDVPVGIGLINAAHLMPADEVQIRAFWDRVKVDFVTANHYQRANFNDPHALWDNEAASQIDARWAKDHDIPYVVTEFGQSFKSLYPRDCVREYLKRQLGPDGNDGAGALWWALYFEEADRWLGSNENGGPLRHKENGIDVDTMGWYNIVDDMYTGLEEKRWG